MSKTGSVSGEYDFRRKRKERLARSFQDKAGDERWGGSGTLGLPQDFQYSPNSQHKAEPPYRSSSYISPSTFPKSQTQTSNSQQTSTLSQYPQFHPASPPSFKLPIDPPASASTPRRKNSSSCIPDTSSLSRRSSCMPSVGSVLGYEESVKKYPYVVLNHKPDKVECVEGSYRDCPPSIAPSLSSLSLGLNDASQFCATGTIPASPQQQQPDPPQLESPQLQRQQRQLPPRDLEQNTGGDDYYHYVWNSYYNRDGDEEDEKKEEEDENEETFEDEPFVSKNEPASDSIEFGVAKGNRPKKKKKKSGNPPFCLLCICLIFLLLIIAIIVVAVVGYDEVRQALGLAPKDDPVAASATNDMEQLTMQRLTPGPTPGPDGGKQTPGLTLAAGPSQDSTLEPTVLDSQNSTNASNNITDQTDATGASNKTLVIAPTPSALSSPNPTSLSASFITSNPTLPSQSQTQELNAAQTPIADPSPVPTDAPRTPQPTNAPRTPQPTDVPRTPQPSDAPRTPQPTTLAPATNAPSPVPTTLVPAVSLPVTPQPIPLSPGVWWSTPWPAPRPLFATTSAPVPAPEPLYASSHMTLRNVHVFLSDSVHSYGVEHVRPEIRWRGLIYYPWTGFGYQEMARGAWYPLGDFDNWCNPQAGCFGHSLLNGDMELRLSIRAVANVDSATDYGWTLPSTLWFHTQNYETSTLETNNGVSLKWRFDVVEL
ncbi:expressed unknown protein [Seminavis robusta]|uniref:Uncharacterized protein n=1 Tax=Seminavis robusta TaxID=568900 RepID=A0A9N8HBT7_9STRA|nr:expressed unknown protein [Seminavis robusta]|eukprot:Sro377_g130120.1 n/a (710) ;mRNA; f:53882-56011